MPQTPPYKNSNESWVNDPNHLLSEDFEEPDTGGAHWFYDIADNLPGNDVSLTKGWNGHPPDPGAPSGPSGRAENGTGVNGTWAGHHGDHDGIINVAHSADHRLSSDTGEFHVRWYHKWDSNYEFAQCKVLAINKHHGGLGDIFWGNIHVNCGGNRKTTGTLQWQPAPGGVEPEGCQDASDVTRGEWMCIELHFKKSTTRSSGDGRIRIWMDACGVNGTTPPASQTLRLDHNNINLGQPDARGGSDSDLVGSLWWESWCNSLQGGSIGINRIDNIVVLNGDNQIGFVDLGGGGGGGGVGGPTGTRLIGMTSARR